MGLHPRKNAITDFGHPGFTAILPTNYDNSWHTAAGVYEARTGTFTPNEGITVDDDYVDTVNAIVKAKMSYAALTIKADWFAAAFGEE